MTTGRINQVTTLKALKLRRPEDGRAFVTRRGPVRKSRLQGTPRWPIQDANDLTALGTGSLYKLLFKAKPSQGRPGTQKQMKPKRDRRSGRIAPFERQNGH